MHNIPAYVGLAAIAIFAVLQARTALKERRERKQITDTAHCATCGEDIRLNERHVTINRHVEYMDSENSVTVEDAESIAFHHLKCAP